MSNEYLGLKCIKEIMLSKPSSMELNECFRELNNFYKKYLRMVEDMEEIERNENKILIWTQRMLE